MSEEKKEKKQKTGASGVSMKDSIRTRLIIIMVALVAIPLALVILISTFDTIRSGEENIVTLNDIQTSKIEADVAGILDQNMSALQTFAAAPSTVMYLEGGGDEALEVDIKDQMIDIDEALADGNNTVLIGPDGQ